MKPSSVLHTKIQHTAWNTKSVIFDSSCSLSRLLSRALHYGHIEILPVIAVKAAIGALYDAFGGPDCTVLRI